jgi:hypothetical protein
MAAHVHSVCSEQQCIRYCINISLKLNLIEIG